MIAPITPTIKPQIEKLDPEAIPNFPNNHPPNTQPTIPTSTLTQKPKPPPLKRSPANHPTTAPKMIQRINDNIALKFI